MAVLVRVSMTREVLSAGQHSSALQPPSPGQRVSNHPLRFMPERAVTDDRVGRIGVDVQDRREVEVESEAPELSPGQRSGALRPLKVIGAREVTRRGHGGDLRAMRRLESLDASPFLVDREERSRGGLRPKSAELSKQRRDLRGRGEVPAKQHHPTRRPALDEPSELGDDILALKPDHHDRGGVPLGLLLVPDQGLPPRRMIVFRIISESEAPGLSLRYIL